MCPITAGHHRAKQKPLREWPLACSGSGGSTPRPDCEARIESVHYSSIASRAPEKFIETSVSFSNLFLQAVIWRRLPVRYNRRVLMTLRGVPIAVFPTQPSSERKSYVYCSNTDRRKLLWISIGRAIAQLADATGITNNRTPRRQAGKVAQSGIPAVYLRAVRGACNSAGRHRQPGFRYSQPVGELGYF
jgi:hypothetical protein